VRAHLDEVRFCYRKRLVEHPELAGRVVVAFTIDLEGSVIDASIATATMRWEFRRPPGSKPVRVEQAFMLSSE
jgi:hypothetical protein